MQTFLPFPDFKKSASVLDRKRLGKQRIEARFILELLLGERTSSTYEYHPIVSAWRGYQFALCCYGIRICEAWIFKGYKDSQLPYFKQKLKELRARGVDEVLPPWIGNEKLHSRYRSTLLFKDDHYQQFGWDEQPALFKLAPEVFVVQSYVDDFVQTSKNI